MYLRWDAPREDGEAVTKDPFVRGEEGFGADWARPMERGRRCGAAKAEAGRDDSGEIEKFRIALGGRGAPRLKAVFGRDR